MNNHVTVFADYANAAAASDLIENALLEITRRWGVDGCMHAVAAAQAIRLHMDEWDANTFAAALAYYLMEMKHHTGELPVPDVAPPSPLQPLH